MTDHDGAAQLPLRPYDGPARRLEYARAELARTPPASGPLDGFLVDPERAQAAIAQLDAAIADIRQSIGAFKFGYVEPPARDPVSMNLAVQIREMDRRAELYVQTWASQIEAFRDAIQAQVDAYRRADEENAERLA